MTGHRTVIEAGPGVVRRICCRTAEQPAAGQAAALEFIDDPVALIDDAPVATARLWRTVLASLLCSSRQPLLVIHPSWWPAPRIVLIAGAAKGLADTVTVLPRSQVLAAAVPGSKGAMIVEIAAGLVAIGGTVAEPRIGTAEQVAETMTRRITALPDRSGVAVLVDSPPDVADAEPLAELIAERLTGARVENEVVDESRLAALAAAVERAQPVPGPAVARGRRLARSPMALVYAALLGLVVVGAGTSSRHSPTAAEVAPSPTFLVEGRVALQVPTQWPVRRITGGPGSARVVVVSPSDPQAMLHLTQSFPTGSLDITAEVLKDAVAQANDGRQSAVFVDFNPAGSAAGRPAVTYRELRNGHHIDWVVLVDGAVRISIGCQSRPDGADAIRAACEQAVRSARAVS